MTLWKKALWAGVAVLASTPAMAQQAPQKGGLNDTGPYQAQPGWFKPGIDRWDQPVIAVALDGDNRIIVGNADQKNTQANALMFHPDGSVYEERSTTSTKPVEQKNHVHQIMVLDADGKVVEDWKQWDDLIAIPHSIHMNPYDKERPVWVIDRDNHQILKFSNDGKKLLMKLGEKGVPGTDHGHFNKPAGLAFLPDGSFYLADGYVNSRVIKFDKAGKFQLEWGTKGAGPGQFNLVHSVTIDANHRVYASDRNNNRVQVFDADGKFIEEWPNIPGAPRVVVTEDNALWLTSYDRRNNRFAKFDLNGKLLSTWGATGVNPGQMDNPHQFAQDSKGNLFIADAWNNRLQKFVPKPGADKSQLMAQEFKFPAK